MTAPLYIQWFIKSSNEYKTKDGKSVEVWEFKHNDDETILKNWAYNFRQNYITNDEINNIISGTEYEGRKKDFLKEKVFPDEKTLYKKRKPRDSIVRIGDFAEILIADFFQFCYTNKYWIPRTRYDSKDNRNFSTKGTDIIGFKFIDQTLKNQNDTLLTVEVKANFGQKKIKKDYWKQYRMLKKILFDMLNHYLLLTKDFIEKIKYKNKKK